MYNLAVVPVDRWTLSVSDMYYANHITKIENVFLFSTTHCAIMNTVEATNLYNNKSNLYSHFPNRSIIHQVVHTAEWSDSLLVGLVHTRSKFCQHLKTEEFASEYQKL